MCKLPIWAKCFTFSVTITRLLPIAILHSNLKNFVHQVVFTLEQINTDVGIKQIAFHTSIIKGNDFSCIAIFAAIPYRLFHGVGIGVISPCAVQIRQYLPLVIL